MRSTVVFILSLLLLYPAVQAQKNIFDTLKSISPDKRLKAARDIYKAELRKVDSVTAFKGFDLLFAVARELDDKPLECWIYDFHADYYSVNRGYNLQSLRYHQQAIDLAGRYSLPVETAIHTFKKAMFYNTWQKYVDANRYLLEAYDLFNVAGLENVPQINDYLHQISIFYYHIGDLESAQTFVLEALRYKHAFPEIELSMTNTLALVVQGLGDEARALDHFTKALDIAKATNDSIWIGIISGNIGAIYFKRGNLDEAIPFFQVCYNESLKFGDSRIAAEAMLFLAKCSLTKGNIAGASDQLSQAEPLVRKVNVLDRWIMFYETTAQLYERMGKPESALPFWKLYNKAKDSLVEVNNVAAVERVKLRWQMDKHQAQVDQLKANARTEVFKRNSLVALLLSLMVISVLVYNRQLLKRGKEKEIFEKNQSLLESEKARAEAELYNATLALERYTENLKQKNELIEEFKARIEQLHIQRPDITDREKEMNLEKLMQAHIMTDDTWDEFKKLFEKVHRGFLLRVRGRFLQATETDIRLITLIKLGLNNKEMANMLGVTVEAIKKSRQRLRKKINLPEDQSIEEIVSLI